MKRKTFEQELETIEWLRKNTPDPVAVEKYSTILQLEQEKYKQMHGHYYRPEVRR